MSRFSPGNPPIPAWILALCIAATLPIASQQAPAATEAAPPSSLPQPQFIRWTRDRFAASLDRLPLHEVLQKLADATGWNVFVEPDAPEIISTRFSNLSTGEALPRLLSNLNYALLPQKNRPAELFVYRTSVQEATRLVSPSEPKPEPPPKKPEDRIPNELIVTLKPGSGLKIEDLAKELGAKVVGQIDGLGAYRLQFKDDEAADAARARLATNESVASVESNYTIPPPRRPELLSQSSNPPLNLKPRNNADGSKLIIGLIDMPVQVQGTVLKDFLLPGLSVASEPAQATRELSHGTSMAETILRGIALTEDASKGTPVRILPVDVYGAREETSTFDVARGVYAAVKEGANLINLSLGSYSDSPILKQIVQQAHLQGVLFFGAAGNEPVTAATYPAAYPDVVAVTAGDRSGRLASYANRGDFVDVMAPGAGVVQFNNRSYLGTGTSFATAYVTGVAAGIASEPGKTLAQVEAEIRQRLGFRPPSATPTPPRTP